MFDYVLYFVVIKGRKDKLRKNKQILGVLTWKKLQF